MGKKSKESHSEEQPKELTLAEWAGRRSKFEVFDTFVDLALEGVVTLDEAIREYKVIYNIEDLTSQQ